MNKGQQGSLQGWSFNPAPRLDPFGTCLEGTGMNQYEHEVKKQMIIEFWKVISAYILWHFIQICVFFSVGSDFRHFKCSFINKTLHLFFETASLSERWASCFTWRFFQVRLVVGHPTISKGFLTFTSQVVQDFSHQRYYFPHSCNKMGSSPNSEKCKSCPMKLVSSYIYSPNTNHTLRTNYYNNEQMEPLKMYRISIWTWEYSSQLR